MIPEFTTDETVVAEEVKEAPVETVVETGGETDTPAELPAESDTPIEKPVEVVQPAVHVDSDRLEKQIEGLNEERTKLLEEIKSLRGDRRELKKEELVQISQKIDELADVNPADISLIDKVLRSKGYLTKDESNKMFYESVKQEEVNKFLVKYPEYKPENDPNDINWGKLQREFNIFATPSDPRLIGDRLERAHKEIAQPIVDRTLDVKRQQLKTAGVGSGGVQRSSSQKSLDPERRFMLSQGGWSEEEIQKIENRL